MNSGREWASGFTTELVFPRSRYVVRSLNDTLYSLYIVNFPISPSLSILVIYKFLFTDNSTNIFVQEAFHCAEWLWFIYLTWCNYQESCVFFWFLSTKILSNAKSTEISILYLPHFLKFYGHYSIPYYFPLNYCNRPLCSLCLRSTVRHSS